MESSGHSRPQEVLLVHRTVVVSLAAQAPLARVLKEEVFEALEPGWYPGP
ncbi:hypothetical protein BGE01nite_36380 [Brevifollis gellanilyticus]|uniref:Uncharacterized protein n=1 Tax=Brevifollis gellanilyticus TaxID=748831 RepID=A0A512MC94_9BACT|nr:hypothetical protein BGE01nite_36380 [Brevifollis gellanilyticus]